MENLVINIINVYIKVLDIDKLVDIGLDLIMYLDIFLNDFESVFIVLILIVNLLVLKLELVNSIIDFIS